MDNTANIFISYSHKDEKLAEQLRYFLRPLEMQGLATVWSDSEIRPGENWANEIKKHLDTAQIILLLVSPDYFASRSLTNKEISKVIVERAKTHAARIIPVLLRPVSLEATPLEKLSPLPERGKAVTQWSNRDMAFLDITENIRNVINDLEVEASPLTGKVQVDDQQKSWEQESSQLLDPDSDEFQELNDELHAINNYIRSYKKKLLVSDDPKQKYNIQHSIEKLESRFNDLVNAYNDLRKKQDLPPRSIDDFNAL